jgi:hypothetical protein
VEEWHRDSREDVTTKAFVTLGVDNGELCKSGLDARSNVWVPTLIDSWNIR